MVPNDGPLISPCRPDATAEKGADRACGYRACSVSRGRSRESACTTARTVRQGQQARNPAQPDAALDISAILRNRSTRIRPGRGALGGWRVGTPRCGEAPPPPGAPSPPGIYISGLAERLSALAWNIRNSADPLLSRYFAFCCPMEGQNVTKLDMYYAHLSIITR